MTAEDLPTTPTVPAELPRKRSGLLSSLTELAITIVMAVAIYLVIQTFVVQTYQVEQESMLDTLRPGQHVLVDKLTPRFADYKRGDIVVFHAPGNPDGETPLIKRVIGVGGEHVAIHDGAVWINGVRLVEPYLNPVYKITAGGNGSSWDVPVGSLFVMGDHRDRSIDSRSFGVVATSAVIGRGWLRFWPVDTLSILGAPSYPEIPASASPAP